MAVESNTLHIGGVSTEALAKKYGTPLYVYDAAIIRERYRNLADHIPYPYLQIHYAVKANSNPAILKLLRQEGAGAEVVSKGLALLAMQAGYKPSQVIYTCNGATTEELQFMADNNILVNIDSVAQLNKWGELKPGSRVSLRLNLDIGAGHHIYTTTGGRQSKFGIHQSEIKTAKQTAKRHGLTIIGLQQHIGSGIASIAAFNKAISALLRVAYQFPDLELLDFGGGFSVPYKPGEEALNMAKLGSTLTAAMGRFAREYGRDLKVIIEPGRYLVAEAGTLLARVTDIKSNPSRTFVSIDTGFNHLIRPAMYFAYHRVSNASRLRGQRRKATVVGNVCESADIFAKDYPLSKPQEDDLIAVHDAGAYGYAMSSLYNGRPRPAEVLIDDGKVRLIRKRQEVENLLEEF